jgi:hypothetical protein
MKRPREDCSCFDNFSIAEQPDKSRVLRDSKLKMLLGRYFNFVQFFKFKQTSLLRCPMDSRTSTKLVQPSSISISSCRTCEKFGDFVRYLELLRLRTFNFLNTCEKHKEEKSTC